MKKLVLAAVLLACAPLACQSGAATSSTSSSASSRASAPSAATSAKPDTTLKADDFAFLSERFADVQILRYQVPGFGQLDAKKKEMLYYLYQAARAGRDIIYDQKFKYNLVVKRTLDPDFLIQQDRQQ